MQMLISVTAPAAPRVQARKVGTDIAEQLAIAVGI